ncbi:MAG TPA: TerC family protein [Verrucomicrobiae bacterium]|nr:TerC family protein [Verrucomicrobiae bacterium]
MTWLSEPAAWISLITLTLLEVVLGIDNVIFISILAGKLPPEQQARARKLGLLAALVTRIILLLGLTWVMGLTKPWFTIPQLPLMKEAMPISGRDLILIVGGLFLIFKSVKEIHEKLEGEPGEASARVMPSFSAVIIQIMLLDIVFSLDSVITAIGMADRVAVMIAAVMIAVGVMLAFAGRISDFVHRHPTLKMLALSFLLLIGFTLMAEGFEVHVPKGYIYFSMAFALGVEMLNLRLRKAAHPVELNQKYK